MALLPLATPGPAPNLLFTLNHPESEKPFKEKGFSTPRWRKPFCRRRSSDEMLDLAGSVLFD